MKKIGIRYEDKFTAERRVPLVPDHVKKLNKEFGIEFNVEPSEKRIFKDEEFVKAGANLTGDFKDCELIIGVKEIVEKWFEDEKTYIFFSHTIKGQDYNMGILRKMIEKRVNIIDYEKIADENGRRLIFFGKFAGLAGMIDTIWALGLRLKHQGIDNPFTKLNQCYTYNSLEEVKAVVREIGEDIKKNGLSKELTPFVTGFTGYGNVSIGAQEIYDLLPVKEITPAELIEIENNPDLPNNLLYKVVFKEGNLSVHKTGKPFELQHYYDNPSEYVSDFEQYIPKLTILMNCMYWTDEYPIIVTKDYLEKNYHGEHKLKIIGDITCDVNGSIECTEKGALVENPIFVYDPKTNTIEDGYEGEGIHMMTVDILPSELPREASEFFSNALLPFIPQIAKADFDVSFEELDLPAPIKRALILHKGKFTPDYEYMEEFIK
ncbi:MAG: hypothetical protein GQ534_06695 [Candidatus Delongbacteria bacterium]|nr:hypothetical protein [Candidatus Delongbacteria bacterium]